MICLIPLMKCTFDRIMKTALRVMLIPVFIFLLWCNLSAQQTYPQNYFRDPLNIPIQLAANFGELRPDHFHMGLDIRTQGRENLPVYAAAEGYISHIKIEKLGYGRAIYIKHPAGYITVYGHLNSFYPQLEKYLKDKQYKDEKWEQDFDLPENMFAVSKGQFIANSGNTGGSAGPHLHFEIRDAKTGNNYNPLLFGLNVPDHIAPLVYGLYWYDRSYSIYTAQPQPIALIKNTNGFTTNGVVKVGSPLITLGIRMEDMNNASTFKFGVYQAVLYVDDVLQFEFRINNFSYDSTRYVNACMDYQRWMKAKQGIQYLSVLPGNKLDIFSPLKSDGKIILNDNAVHKIRIELSDEHDNTTTINLQLQYNPSLQKNYTIPANAVVCDVHEPNNIETANAKIHFDESAFYDALPLIVTESSSTTANQVSSTIHVSDFTIPVHDDYSISIKANTINTTLKNKVVMQLKSSGTPTVVKGTWNNDWETGSFDELGDVCLLIDTIAPKILAVNWKNGTVFSAQRSLTIKCTDDVSKIVNFTAKLDGKWLLFNKKTDFFIYNFDEHCSTGTHTLLVTATDVAGNEATQIFNFTKQ